MVDTSDAGVMSKAIQRCNRRDAVGETMVEVANVVNIPERVAVTKTSTTSHKE